MSLEKTTKPPPLTMADVAARAGVSTMTVSRALRGGSSIAPETRAKIMQAVEELGYVLDLSAGSLSSKRTCFVAALIPSINNSNFADTVSGITDALDQFNIQLLLADTDYSLEREEKLIEAMLRRRPEGMILTSGYHTDRSRKLLQTSGIPIIETWDLPRQPLQHVVGFSNSKATIAVVKYLYDKGYRRIGFIGGVANNYSLGDDRRRGYETAIAELKNTTGRVISFNNAPITMRQGGEAIRQLLQQWPEIEAAVCVCDTSAFGAIMECRRHDLAVPGRLAVTGFGDFEMAAFSCPSISTVKINSYELGLKAGQLMLRAITQSRQGSPLPNETIIMDYSIIARESA